MGCAYLKDTIQLRILPHLAPTKHTGTKLTVYAYLLWTWSKGHARCVNKTVLMILVGNNVSVKEDIIKSNMYVWSVILLAKHVTEMDLRDVWAAETMLDWRELDADATMQELGACSMIRGWSRFSLEGLVVDHCFSYFYSFYHLVVLLYTSSRTCKDKKNMGKFTIVSSNRSKLSMERLFLYQDQLFLSEIGIPWKQFAYLVNSRNIGGL